MQINVTEIHGHQCLMAVIGNSYLYCLRAYLSFKHQHIKNKNHIYRHLTANRPHYSHLVQPLHANANENLNFQVETSTDMRQLNYKLFLAVTSQREPLHHIYCNTPKHLCATVGQASDSTFKFLPQI